MTKQCKLQEIALIYLGLDMLIQSAITQSKITQGDIALTKISQCYKTESKIIPRKQRGSLEV